VTHRLSDNDISRPEVEAAVLAYLHRHPEAADTLDGIVLWWLPRQRYETARERIGRVLDDLVARGELRCERLPGGAALYGLRRSAEPRSP
jgi:hypothetical protein